MQTESREERHRNMLMEQIERRCRRGLEEIAGITNRGKHTVYSTFEVGSASGRHYQVQIRSLTELLNSCNCPDYKTNTLGTCKHIEGVLQHLQSQYADSWDTYVAQAPAIVLVTLQRDEEPSVHLSLPLSEAGELKPLLSRYFDAQGVLQGRLTRSLPALVKEHKALSGNLRERLVISPDVIEYLREQQDNEAVAAQKQWFLEQVEQGRRSFRVIDTKLYPFQEQGVLHLAFGRRVVLADDMGLGKTIQAIAATALLRQLRDIKQVLVVTPASLKHQWAREIQRFTSLPVQVVEGNPMVRRERYRDLKFFNIINYELVMYDERLLGECFFDLVILDEAQRIKNWRTKTATCVKRLPSRYAFVLTGTPLENRLDDLYSIFQFVDPHILGPLWRFNERYYEVERRPSGTYKVLGYKNLDGLRKRIRPYVSRRRREDVLLDLPARIDNNFFVKMTDRQLAAYTEYESKLARLMSRAKRRPLTPEEHKLLQGYLVKMRLICNALALHDPEIPAHEREKTSPKLAELREILQEEVAGNGHKAVIFSQWTTMLAFCEPLLEKLGTGWVKLTGEIPSHKRGELIDRFGSDSECRVFLSSDAGGVGLNLQAASMVINLDLPWNPAVLDQRIARAHRHGQKRPVHVINLVAKDTIEERILDTLAAKRSVFDAALNVESEVTELSLSELGQNVLQRLEVLLEEKAVTPALQLTPVVAQAEAEELAAEAEPAVTVKLLADALVAHCPGRILLVREMPSPAAAGVTKILVVVDKDPGALRTELSQVVADQLERLGNPEMMFMEQESYRAFCALMGDALPGAADKVAYQSPGVVRPDAQRPDRLHKAEAGLEKAQKRLELTRVILQGGFPEEVLRPLHQALGLALNAGLCIGKECAVNEKPPAPRAVEARLVVPGVLAADEAAEIERIRVLTAPAQEGDEELPPPGSESLSHFIALVQELIDRQRERIVAERLKK